jgi:hypothetical protein
MDVIFYIKLIAALALFLTMLVLLLFYKPQKKEQKKQKKDIKVIKVEKQYSLNEILTIVKKKESTSKELGDAISYLVKHYVKIHPKLGLRAHPDFDIYSEIILRICRHPNTNKDIILLLDRELEKHNH